MKTKEKTQYMRTDEGQILPVVKVKVREYYERRTNKETGEETAQIIKIKTRGNFARTWEQWEQQELETPVYRIRRTKLHEYSLVLPDIRLPFTIQGNVTNIELNIRRQELKQIINDNTHTL